MFIFNLYEKHKSKNKIKTVEIINCEARLSFKHLISSYSQSRDILIREDKKCDGML